MTRRPGRRRDRLLRPASGLNPSSGRRTGGGAAVRLRDLDHLTLGPAIVARGFRRWLFVAAFSVSAARRCSVEAAELPAVPTRFLVLRDAWRPAVSRLHGTITASR